MKTVGVYVFSGTGNTLRCASYLRDTFLSSGVSADLHQIECFHGVPEEETLVICYPIHGFNAPLSVIRFCKALPPENKAVYFLKTSGEPSPLNDNSSARLKSILRGKGYLVKGEFHYIMPYNMVFRHSDAMASKMWGTAQARIPDAARRIAAGEQIPARVSLPARFMSALCRIEHGFYPLNGRLYRIRKDLCTRCMRCVKNCPAGNIRFENGKFSFGGSCLGCTRCSFRCPQDAIRIGLLDFMRVNGPYDFSQDPEEAVIGRFCRRSYERYFRDSASR